MIAATTRCASRSFAVPIALRCAAAASSKTPTFLDFPPMQKGASFNLDAVKAEIKKRVSEAAAAAKGPGQ